MTGIPLVDLGAGATAVRRSVESACSAVGFMRLGGHGIPASIVDAMRSAVVAYFERPLADKLADCITRDNYRGYIPQGFFSANAGGAPADLYEGYKLHRETPADAPVCRDCDLYGPNRWPAAPAGFREAVLDYWRACDEVSRTLLACFAAILDVPAAQFLGWFDEPLTNMTLLHYPPQPGGRPGFGIHPHKDTDVLTMLVPDPVGGLMVRPRGETRWIDVPADDDALVVNIGDMLELWSGGYLVSTPHKVVNRSGRERYSFPYFVVPRHDVVVEPLLARQAGFDRGGVRSGAVSREVWRTNWPDAMPQDPALDLGTLAD